MASSSSGDLPFVSGNNFTGNSPTKAKTPCKRKKQSAAGKNPVQFWKNETQVL